MTKEVMKQALDALNTPRPSDSYPPPPTINALTGSDVGIR